MEEEIMRIELETKISKISKDLDRAIALLAAFEERIAPIEKTFAKSKEKSVFQLMCELEELKDILLDETPTGKPKKSNFAKKRIGRFDSIKRRI